MSIAEDATFAAMRQIGYSYFSKSFEGGDTDAPDRAMRYGVRVVDSDNQFLCDTDVEEIVIRRTPGGRQQVKALFFEDNRGIRRLTFQRFSSQSQRPHKNSFVSFEGSEIQHVRALLDAIDSSPIPSSDSVRLSDNLAKSFAGSDEDLLELLAQQKHRLGQIAGASAIGRYLELMERQRQVREFEELLANPERFREEQERLNCRGPEAVWQHFLEKNPWIFGLGLSPIFLSPLIENKLEQVIRGYSITGEGKRVDGLMRTNGLLSSICLVEIKTHKTQLLEQAKPYRPGVWQVSKELAGATSQCQVNVETAMHEFHTRVDLKDSEGNPLGREAFLYQPRSYLVVGTLSQFRSEHGPNESKYRTFELYRRNLRSPEVVTFDELLERARAITNCGPALLA